jgi:hypothetical protein
MSSNVTATSAATTTRIRESNALMWAAASESWHPAPHSSLRQTVRRGAVDTRGIFMTP